MKSCSDHVEIHSYIVLPDCGSCLRTKQDTAVRLNSVAVADSATNTVNGARLGDLFALSPLAAASWNADLQVTADCIANNSIVITRRNLGTNSLSSDAGVWMVHMTRPNLMETLKQTFNRHGASIAAMARYVTYAAVLSYSQWHISVKDSWTTLTSWDQINVACAVVLNMLVAIGAVMNGTWQKAKDYK